jgi:hypothetical protein
LKTLSPEIKGTLSFIQDPVFSGGTEAETVKVSPSSCLSLAIGICEKDILAPITLLGNKIEQVTQQLFWRGIEGGILSKRGSASFSSSPC